MTPQLYIATNGLGVWTSDDLGETLTRMNSRTGMYSGYHIWAFANDPSDANALFAGTNGGLYRLDRRQMKWSHIPSPMDERFKITAIAFSPHNPDVIIAGTQFAALYRSEDHGRTWRLLDLDLPEICPGNMAQARFTQIVLDPHDAKLGWAGVELDYVWHTTDGGLSWRKITNGLTSGDIHGLAVVNEGRRRVLASTDRGLHISDDDGETWRLVSTRFSVKLYPCSRAERRQRRRYICHQRRWSSRILGTPLPQPRPGRTLGARRASRRSRELDVVDRSPSCRPNAHVRLGVSRTDLSQYRRRRDLDRSQASARGDTPCHVAAGLVQNRQVALAAARRPK